jgi:citrate lyase beta subunit
MIQRRQPVHTVFGGAHLFRADVAARFGVLALQSLDAFAGDAATLASALGLATEADTVYARVREKLSREPVEDYRIDFEDGYGVRADADEDGHAVSAAREMAAGLAADSLPACSGIRIKSLAEHERARAVRTLTLFLATLLEKGGHLPPNFVVTVPKVVDPAQVEAFVETLAALERELAIERGSLRFEVMIETPGIVLGPDGRSPLPRLVEAGGARLTGAIFGAYDFTAALGITAAHQGMRHPACDAARQMMLLAFAGTRLRLSDGATAVLPVPLHRAPPSGVLTEEQAGANRRSVHAAWRLHYGNVRHSMANGFYQGWDLHPAQLVSRYAATFAFFLEGVDAAGTRLRNFIEKAAQATRVGAAFDDAATGRGLLNFFRLAVNCGAITEGEAASRCGMRVETLRELAF